MTRSTSLPLRLAALLGSAAIIAACTGTTASPSAAPATEAPSASAAVSEAPYDGLAYPADGEAPCGTAPYTGLFKKITAVDRVTVEFQLCNPDVAFLSKIAFSAFGIQDSAYLEAHAADKSYLDNPNGTGPYKLGSWEKGNRLVLNAYDGYWGTAALTPNVEFRWSDEAAQRWLELQAGSVDGIDNPGTDDIEAIKADTNVKFNEREGLNTFYLGFNNTVEPWDDVNVRKAIAMGIDRERIVSNFYPEGSEVATHFTPCAIPFGCEGEETWGFDAAAATGGNDG